MGDQDSQGEVATCECTQGKVVTLERIESTVPGLIGRLNPLFFLELILQVAEEATLLDLELKLFT